MQIDKKFIDSIMPVILAAIVAYLVYMFLKTQGLIKKEVSTSTAVTSDCPRGAYYTRGLFGNCDPNYEQKSLEGDIFSGGRCVCISSSGKR